MLGKRSPQRGMFEADHLYLDFVEPDTFYGFLARHRAEIFRTGYLKGRHRRRSGYPTDHRGGRTAGKCLRQRRGSAFGGAERREHRHAGR